MNILFWVLVGLYLLVAFVFTLANFAMWTLEKDYMREDVVAGHARRAKMGYLWPLLLAGQIRAMLEDAK